MEYYMENDREKGYFDDIDKKPNSLIIISVINFIFGGCAFAYFSFFTLIILYGLLFSGDPVSDKLAGVIGGQCLGFPGLMASILFIFSGLGLLKLKGWGYYLQMATAILAILSLVGIPYGVPVLITLLNPQIKRLFSEDRKREQNYLPYIE